MEFLRCDLVGARFSGVDARGLVLHEVNGNGCLFIDTPLAGISIGGGSWAASVFKECPETRHAAGWESLEAIEQQEEEAWVIRGPRPAKRLKPGEPPRSEFSELGAPELMTWEDDWVLETIATGRAVVGIEIKQEPDASSRKAAVRLFSQSAARFVDCRFLTADFRGVEFAPGTAFVSCRFEKGALFDGAHLDELSFSDCYLAGASLKNVSAARVMITNSVLDACDISGGNFDDATIGRSVLRGVQGNRQTTFRRSAFSGRTALRDLNLRGSLFTGATFADSLIVGSSFDDCTFERARFLAMTWSNTDFIRSDLSHAYFVDNDLSDVAFHHSDLRGVVLRNCQGATELEAEELASSGSGMVLRYILT